MKSFFRGIAALIIVSGILLFSDLQNRSHNNGISKSLHAGNSKAMFKISLVHYVDSPNSEDCEKGIRKALGENNLKENSDYSIKVFNAQGDISTLNSIAGSLANEKWDLVFCLSTPTLQVMMKKLSGQKIVFTNVGDPVIAGAGKSSTDHMPDICGVSTMSDFEGLIKLVKILQPAVKRVGTVFTPSEINSVAYKDNLAAAAKRAGLELIAAPAGTATEVMEAAKSLASDNIDAFCQISDNLTGSSGTSILKVSNDNKIPFYAFVSNQMKQGAMAACARDYFLAGFDAGEMGIQVLSGKSPGQIPFRNVSKTNFILNSERVAFYGISVPENLMKTFPNLQIISK